MSDSADPRSIAAHLAAALIAGKTLENAKGGQAASAAKIYFDVLDAILAEHARRYASPAGRTNA
jgi:hypothetical protein